MRYPLLLDLDGRPVLVVGGGRVAARRAADLVAAGAAVTVVAPEVVRRARLGRGHRRTPAVRPCGPGGDVAGPRVHRRPRRQRGGRPFRGADRGLVRAGGRRRRLAGVAGGGRPGRRPDRLRQRGRGSGPGAPPPGRDRGGAAQRGARVTARPSRRAARSSWSAVARATRTCSPSRVLRALRDADVVVDGPARTDRSAHRASAGGGGDRCRQDPARSRDVAGRDQCPAHRAGPGGTAGGPAQGW